MTSTVFCLSAESHIRPIRFIENLFIIDQKCVNRRLTVPLPYLNP